MIYDIKPILKYLILALAMSMLVMWLASCSPKVGSISESKEDIGDFSVNIALDTNYLQHLKPRVLIKLDSALKGKDSLNDKQKEKVADIIYKEIEKEVPKNIGIDTTLQLKDSTGVSLGEVSLITNGQGQLIITGHTIKRTVYMKQNFIQYVYAVLNIDKWWEKVLFWLGVLIAAVLMLWGWVKP